MNKKTVRVPIVHGADGTGFFLFRGKIYKQMSYNNSVGVDPALFNEYGEYLGSFRLVDVIFENDVEYVVLEILDGE